MKSSTPELRRSPRLNPQPRRSPRIKDQNEGHANNTRSVPVLVEEMAAPVVDKSASLRRSPRLHQKVRKTTTTYNGVTPIRKRTPVTKLSTSSKKSGPVKFRRSTHDVQKFNENDPSSSLSRVIRNTLGKRLFQSSTGESCENRPKRTRNNAEERGMIGNERASVHTKTITFAGGVVAAVIAFVIGKFYAVKW